VLILITLLETPKSLNVFFNIRLEHRLRRVPFRCSFSQPVLLSCLVCAIF
jgi:hypothetical protein